MALALNGVVIYSRGRWDKYRLVVQDVPWFGFAGEFDVGRADVQSSGRGRVDVNGAASVAFVVERRRHQ